MTSRQDDGTRLREPEATATATATERFSATWTPGATTLTGTCFCGARHHDSDPVAMWDWLDAHPVGHDGQEGL
jgi:hypothetical protein